MPEKTAIPPELAQLRAQAPRPLGLYMMLLTSIGQTAFGRAALNHPTLAAEVQAYSTAQMGRFLEGLRQYRAAPPRPRVQPVKTWPLVGRVQLLQLFEGQGLAPVILVPSLINRWWIFDLLRGQNPSASLAETLAQAGHPVFALDWGTPEADGAPLSLENIVCDAVVTASQMVADICHKAPALVGYCMGGLLALAAAAQPCGQVAKVICAATPWSFAAMPGAGLLQKYQGLYTDALGHMQQVPVDVLQGFFMLLGPMGAVRRLQAFVGETDAAQRQRMAALEDWLCDVVALEGPIARACLTSWYGENQPARGLWQVAGVPVTAENVGGIPLLVAYGAHDTLVPPPAATPLAQAFAGPDTTVLEVPTGHVGLMAGRKAQQAFFEPVIRWLGQN